MVWLDTNLQQMLVDESLLNIGFYIERWQEIEDMEDEMKRLRAYVNEHLWDERTAFLYDRYGDGMLCTTKGIGAFWALQADALDKERLDRMVAHLSDTTEFDRPHRVPSLSADHPKYNPLDQDVKLKDAIDKAETKAEKDSIRDYSQDRTVIKSVSFNNVRVNIKSKNPMPYDPANFTLGYSYSINDKKNPETEYETTKDYLSLIHI